MIELYLSYMKDMNQKLLDYLENDKIEIHYQNLIEFNRHYDIQNKPNDLFQILRYSIFSIIIYESYCSFLKINLSLLMNTY